jgi:transcriptional regulator with XRE-family HTH domain
MKKASPTKAGRLAKKLLRIRKGLKLSQSQILERLGFSEHLFRSNISQYERGDRVPPPPVLLEYARLTNVDLAVLIDDDLDLPPEIPSKEKYQGVKRKSTSRRRRL